MARGGPQALSDVPLFSGLSRRHLKHVASMAREEDHAEGAVLAEEGRVCPRQPAGFWCSPGLWRQSCSAAG